MLFDEVYPLISRLRDLAYADDLLTLASSLPTLRLKALTVQAFADIFGLEIAHNKLSGYFVRLRLTPDPLFTSRPRHTSSRFLEVANRNTSSPSPRSTPASLTAPRSST
jgi:hypothetical protein